MEFVRIFLSLKKRWRERERIFLKKRKLKWKWNHVRLFINCISCNYFSSIWMNTYFNIILQSTVNYYLWHILHIFFYKRKKHRQARKDYTLNENAWGKKWDEKRNESKNERRKKMFVKNRNYYVDVYVACWKGVLEFLSSFFYSNGLIVFPLTFSSYYSKAIITNHHTNYYFAHIRLFN